MGRSAAFPVLVLVPLALTSCVAADAQPRLVEGGCEEVYQGEVCTWTRVAENEVVDLGATVPLSVIENAPPDAEMVFPPKVSAMIPLPAEAREATGLQWLTIYWEPHGHPPGPYMYPHFDFHFYNVPRSAISAIDCADERKPESLPAGYILPDEEIPGLGVLVGLCVPGMGMHALLEEEFHGTEPFTGTMVVGYYEQSPIFIEPMITQEMLMRRTSFDLDVPRVETPEGVRYPTRFHAEYQPDTDAYRFTFSGL